MKYIAVIDTDDFEDFKFFEDGNGKYLAVKDANAKPDEWMALQFIEYKVESEELDDGKHQGEKDG